jgi:hypothetical protein
MSSSFSQSPVLNLNFFVQNNIHINGTDLPKGKQAFYEQSSAPSPFEFKERAKKPSPFEFEEKKPANKLIPIASSPISEDIATHAEVSSPQMLLKPIPRESDMIYEGRTEPLENDSITELLGYTFLIGAFTFFVLTMFAFFGSAIIGKTGHIVLDFLLEDSYYCFLLPLLVPLTIIITYLNWLSIKFFRHT